MITEDDVRFGWIPSSDEKLKLHDTRYAFTLFFPMVYAQAVEYTFPYDARFIAWNKQKGNSCVGASWSQYMALCNFEELGPMQYDWYKLYSWACANDNDPATSAKADVGTYLWAGGDCLRKVGHWQIVNGVAQPPDIKHGIKSYYWIKSAEEARTAIGLYKRPLEFGVRWHKGWMNPVLKNGEYWLPPRAKWGPVVGGHAICADAGSDQRGGDRWHNTWGAEYPPVWVSYEDIDYILTQDYGECCVAIDYEEPPEPEPEPVEAAVPETIFGTDEDGKVYSWKLEEVAV